MKHLWKVAAFLLLAAVVLTACGGKAPGDQGGYVLTTALRDGKLVYVGVGSDIEGRVNPDLKADPGQEVTITLISGEGAEHDIFLPDVDAKTSRVSGQGNSTSVTFTAPKRAGSYKYMDSVPGHAEAGMQGYLLVGGASAPAAMRANDPAKLGLSGGPVTRDNTGAEVYCTIFALVESPHERDVLWAGTDDGLVHVTRDRGRSWQPVTPPDLPEWVQADETRLRQPSGSMRRRQRERHSPQAGGQARLVTPRSRPRRQPY